MILWVYNFPMEFTCLAGTSVILTESTPNTYWRLSIGFDRFRALFFASRPKSATAHFCNRSFCVGGIVNQCHQFRFPFLFKFKIESYKSHLPNYSDHCPQMVDNFRAKDDDCVPVEWPVNVWMASLVRLCSVQMTFHAPQRNHWRTVQIYMDTNSSKSWCHDSNKTESTEWFRNTFSTYYRNSAYGHCQASRHSIGLSFPKNHWNWTETGNRLLHLYHQFCCAISCWPFFHWSMHQRFACCRSTNWNLLASKFEVAEQSDEYSIYHIRWCILEESFKNVIGSVFFRNHQNQVK